jgi:hypothetical protein
VKLAFVFLCVTFRDSPFLRSSHVLTKDTDSTDSARPIHYSTPVTKLTYLSVYDSRDGSSEHGASPSSPSSLTYVHRCIGSRNPTRQTLTNSTRLTYLSVYDNRDDASEPTPSPSPPLLAHACTQVHLFSQPYLTDVAQLREIDVSKCV